MYVFNKDKIVREWQLFPQKYKYSEQWNNNNECYILRQKQGLNTTLGDKVFQINVFKIQRFSLF